MKNYTYNENKYIKVRVTFMNFSLLTNVRFDEKYNNLR